MTATRLDAALTARGLARSRTAAARLIAEGLVDVDGTTILKSSAKVSEAQEIVVTRADRYVSRGAHKLLAALDAFGLEPSGVVLDLGASTGGFSQVALERGATTVIALDVGHGQLAPQLRDDDRVVVVEGYNVRDLTPDDVAAFAPDGGLPSLVVGDLSFISLTLVLEPIARSAPGADIVLLVKPQFEVGRTGIREGIVRDAGLRADAIESVLWRGWDVGLTVAGLIPSPIVGSHGNHEYLVWMRAHPSDGNPTEWREHIADMLERET